MDLNRLNWRAYQIFDSNIYCLIQHLISRKVYTELENFIQKKITKNFQGTIFGIIYKLFKLLKPCDMGAIAVLKNKYRSWLASKFAEREEKNPDKYQKMSKCAEIVASLNKKTIQFCWRKAQLTDTEAQIECPNEMENIESAIQEERILNYIEEKMAALDIEDEEETVELVPLEEEPFIENEPILIDDERPMKKIKQEKITSFFLKK